MSLQGDVIGLVRATDLSALGVTQPSVQVRRSVGTDTPTLKPFIVLTWMTVTPSFKNVGRSLLQVWVYHETSYSMVDQILHAVHTKLRENSTAVGDVEWNGNSDDLYDDIFKCVTRYASFTFPSVN